MFQIKAKIRLSESMQNSDNKNYYLEETEEILKAIKCFLGGQEDHPDIIAIEKRNVEHAEELKKFSKKYTDQIYSKGFSCNGGFLEPLKEELTEYFRKHLYLSEEVSKNQVWAEIGEYMLSRKLFGSDLFKDEPKPLGRRNKGVHLYRGFIFQFFKRITVPNNGLVFENFSDTRLLSHLRYWMELNKDSELEVWFRTNCDFYVSDQSFLNSVSKSDKKHINSTIDELMGNVSDSMPQSGR